jgi:hypothetical protein
MLFLLEVASGLFEEFFVSQMLAYLNVLAFSAEFQNLAKQRIIEFLKFPNKAYPPSLHSDLKYAIIVYELIETQLSPSILFKDIPILN